MGLFKKESTEIEKLAQEMLLKSRLESSFEYIVEEDEFIEVKIGSKDGDNIQPTGELSTESDE